MMILNQAQILKQPLYQQTTIIQTPLYVAVSLKTYSNQVHHNPQSTSILKMIQLLLETQISDSILLRKTDPQMLTDYKYETVILVNFKLRSNKQQISSNYRDNKQY